MTPLHRQRFQRTVGSYRQSDHENKISASPTALRVEEKFGMHALRQEGRLEEQDNCRYVRGDHSGTRHSLAQLEQIVKAFVSAVALVSNRRLHS